MNQIITLNSLSKGKVQNFFFKKKNFTMSFIMPNVGKNKNIIIINMSLIRGGLRHKVAYRIVLY